METTNNPVLFGWDALVTIVLYLFSMIFIGWLARRKRRNNNLTDFYLAGRSLGVVALFLSLYATQYSGNTLFGYTGTAYRIGFGWTVSLLFMFSVIVGYLLFAPRLIILARSYNFITPGDYIAYRFRSPSLTLVTTLLMIYVLANYTLAQLKAMGAAVQGITQGSVPAAYGIVMLAIIMVIYETLGGMRSVAWTDVIQGIMLLIGFLVLLFMIPSLAGGLPTVVERLSQIDPSKIQVPSLEGCNTWISYIFLFGFGAAIYPQAIQRLYASRSLSVLKRSLALMTFMPLTTALIATICGVVGIVVLPEVTLGETDQVLSLMLSLILNKSLFGYWLIVFILAAALAALMSTADSALLSMSSMITKDIFKVYFLPKSSEAHLTSVGKWASWVIVTLLVLVAISTQTTLIRLLELKFEVLIQIAPCFFLGLYWKQLNSKTVLVGLLAGLLVGLGLTGLGYSRILGFHAGVIGLLVNFACCLVGTALSATNFNKNKKSGDSQMLRPFDTG